MAPRIDGRTHRFAEHGLYDGLFIMRDEESGTYWDHMTGDAVVGPLVGSALEVSNLLQTTPRQVLERDDQALLGISERARRGDERLKLDGLLAGVRGRLSRLFRSTVDREDDRRPTMDLGLGIWEGGAARYYPYESVMAEGRAVVDVFGGRRVVVYLDPAAYALTALYTEADGASWEGDELVLSDGSRVHEGVLHDASGARVHAPRPLQVFTRWYGFALTFGDAEIYGEAR